jgi:hypothetical protein
VSTGSAVNKEGLINPKREVEILLLPINFGLFSESRILRSFKDSIKKILWQFFSSYKNKFKFEVDLFWLYLE